VSYSALVRGGAARPAAVSFGVAFFVSLGSFALLRIADEFKDAAEDARFRPYRPVPRGLVKLRELAGVGVAIGAVQLALALWLGWRAAPAAVQVAATGDANAQTGGLPWRGLRLAGLLGVTWLYFALMSREFFARAWLKARPVVYLFSHMLIMPLIDWFATGCDWVHAGGGMPEGLFWFLAASFCNGVVIELGRKIRAPEQEETGVETYTFLWGRPVAVAAWLAAQLATLGCALVAARRIGFGVPVGCALGLLWAGALGLGGSFVRRAQGKRAKGIETYSGLWTLALYLMLGVVPLAIRWVR
jgi:4-hydroxybenzoate polyprenyltransferase